MSRTILVITASAVAVCAGPASAADVTLSALLVNSCVLSVTTPGVMTPATTGQRIGSEESGGSAATLTVVSIGLSPTMSFTAPTLTSSPAGWSASPTLSVRYTSVGGVNQAYTSSASSHSMSGLTDAFTVHGRVDSSSGFAAGNYTLRTVATCSQ